MAGSKPVDRKHGPGSGRRLTVVFGVISAPIITFLVVRAYFEGKTAELAYFEAVAQLIPILIVALVIETRYVTTVHPVFKRFGLGRTKALRRVALIYPVMAFSFVLLSEVVALFVLATGNVKPGYAVGVTAGGLAAGVVALLTSLLFSDSRAA